MYYRISYFLQIEAHKVNYKANNENSLYMNYDFKVKNSVNEKGGVKACVKQILMK